MSGFTRKLDLSKFGGDDSDDDSPGPSNPRLSLGVEKQQTFVHGINRKSKRDIERDNEKRKREEQERESARVFAEFTAEFEGEGSASSSKAGGGFVRAGGSKEAYVPSKPPPDRGRRAFQDAPPPPASSSAPKQKGKRQMDSFLEEMKRDQAAREERFQRSGGKGGSVSVHAAWEQERGSYDKGDLLTTNLYVGNLPEAAKEQSLGMLFAKMGPVGSVKIFWPRFDEPPPGTDVHALHSRRVGPKSGLTGFVAFMRREDAERALKEYDGLDWGGSILKVGWSKAVSLPARPSFVLPAHSGNSRRDRSRSRSPPYKRGRSRSPARQASSSSSAYGSRNRSPPPPKTRPMPQFNLAPDVERFIRAVADKVVQVGQEFEVNLIRREGTEGRWKFLDKEADLPECHLYRFLVNPHYRMPTPPPKPFVDEGYDSTYSTDPSEASEDERVIKGKIGKLARKRFVSCLRGMRGERGSIARVMAMALKHADAADDIADMIVQSLTIFETPIPVKVARLFLISDILSNCASPIPNAWKYRDVLEARLRPVFDHFGELYQSFKAQAGRLTAETFRGQIAGVLDVLDHWLIFNPEVTQDLRLRLAGIKPRPSPSPVTASTDTQPLAAQHPQAAPDPPTSRFKKSAFASAVQEDVSMPPGDLDGRSLPAMGGGEEEEEEEEEEEDLDGEAMEEDLDGAPMEDDEDLDGAPMED